MSARSEEEKEKREQDVVERFTEGYDLYWAGNVPEGWDGPDAKNDPLLAGWNMAADQENQQNWFQEEEA